MILKTYQILAIGIVGLFFYHFSFAKTLEDYKKEEQSLVERLQSFDPQSLTQQARQETRLLFKDIGDFLSLVSNSDLSADHKSEIIIDLAQKASYGLDSISHHGFTLVPSKYIYANPVADVLRRAGVAWAQAQANLWTLRFLREHRARRALLKQIMRDLKTSIIHEATSAKAAAARALILKDVISSPEVTNYDADQKMLAAYGAVLVFFIMHVPFDFFGIPERTHFSGFLSSLVYDVWQLFSAWAFVVSSGASFAHDVTQLERDFEKALGNGGCRALFENPKSYLENLKTSDSKRYGED